MQLYRALELNKAFHELPTLKKCFFHVAINTSNPQEGFTLESAYPISPKNVKENMAILEYFTTPQGAKAIYNNEWNNIAPNAPLQYDDNHDYADNNEWNGAETEKKTYWTLDDLRDAGWQLAGVGNQEDGDYL